MQLEQSADELMYNMQHGRKLEKSEEKTCPLRLRAPPPKEISEQYCISNFRCIHYQLVYELENNIQIKTFFLSFLFKPKTKPPSVKRTLFYSNMPQNAVVI